MTTAMYAADWEPPDNLPAGGSAGSSPGLDGPPHRTVPQPGWRCACGQLTLAAVIGHRAVHPGHEPIVDAISAEDPATDPDYLAQYVACDQRTWDALLRRTDHTDRGLDRLVAQATGWPDYDYARASDLMGQLLTSAVPLNRRSLIRLTDGDGVQSPTAAAALVAHPSCDVQVECALVHSLSNSWGGPRYEGRAGDRAAAVLNALLQHPHDRVRAVARIRRAGVAAWHPRWQEVSKTLAGVRQAEAHLSAAMVELDQFGPAGWELTHRLLDERVAAVDLVAAVSGVLMTNVSADG